MSYLSYVMNGLGNILYNTSNNPSEKTCNEILDSIKRMLEDYNQSGGNVNITDHRENKHYKY